MDEQEEGKRPLREYMGLPPSQYSVLDAQTVTRIDDNTFKCEPTPSLFQESRSITRQPASKTDAATLSWHILCCSFVSHSVATPLYELGSRRRTIAADIHACMDDARH